MGKARLPKKDLTKLQELRFELQRVKKENSQLRKQMARMDLDKYDQLKKTIKKHYKKDETQQGNDILDKVKQEWKCKCENCVGFLEIFLYTKMGETWYFRQCSDHPHCKNRTKAQKYAPTVKGIMKKETKDE